MRLRSTPIPSTSSSTTSPGCSQRSSPCSRMHPVPTVPEPRTSPGRSLVLRAACATIASQEWYMSARLPRDRSSPFTRASIVPPLPSNSSGVTTTGPRLVAKSFPFAGPRPERNACSVCAASWTTVPPSTTPGQPRSSVSSRGVNMHSFTTLSSRFRVDDHVGHVRARAADSLLDLARAGVGVRKRRARVQAERDVDEQSVTRLQETELTWLGSSRLAYEAHDGIRIDVVRLSPACLLGEWLQVRLHGVHLGDVLDDGALDLRRRLVRVLERQMAWQLQMERHLRSAADVEDAHVVHFAHLRNAERGAVRS